MSWTNGGRTQHPETLTLVKFKDPPCLLASGRFAIQIPYSPFWRQNETNGADQKFSFTRPAVTGTSVPCLEQ